jgi:hypothetical protein
MIKWVWYNIETGEFSNSWNEKDHEQAGGTKSLLDPTYHKSTWKLIRYECVSDENFEFMNLMKGK